MLIRRHLISGLLALSGVAGIMGATGVWAQGAPWPARGPIKLVAVFPPGRFIIESR